MQFPVPQFIDVEDKLIGPFSVKQFAFIFAGGLLIVAMFRIFKLSIPFFILSLPVLAVTVALAFGKFNGRHIYDSFPIFIQSMTAPKNLIFQKKSDIDDLHIQSITLQSMQKQQAISQPVMEEAPQSKLKRLSRMLQEKNAEEEEIVNTSRGITGQAVPRKPEQIV